MCSRYCGCGGCFIYIPFSLHSCKAAAKVCGVLVGVLDKKHVVSVPAAVVEAAAAVEATAVTAVAPAEAAVAAAKVVAVWFIRNESEGFLTAAAASTAVIDIVAAVFFSV